MRTEIGSCRLLEKVKKDHTNQTVISSLFYPANLRYVRKSFWLWDNFSTDKILKTISNASNTPFKQTIKWLYHKCSIPLSLTRSIDETSHSRFSSDGTLEDLPLIARATTNGTWYRCFIRWLLSVFSLLAGRTGSRGTGIGPPIPYHFTTERTYARSVSPRRGPCCLSRHAPIGSRIFVH